MVAKPRLKVAAERVARFCVGSRLRKLNRVVTNLYNAEFAELGITAGQFSILTALAHSPSRSASTIGKVLSLEKSSLSRNLRLMRRNGWIECEAGARSVGLCLSAEGEKIYAQAIPAWERAQSKCEKILGAEFTKDLHRAIEAGETAR